MKTILLIIALIAFAQAAYVLVPPSQYNHLPILQGSLSFGLNYSLNYLINQGSLINVAYHITANNSIYNQTVSGVVDYKFNVNLTNVQGDNVNLQMIVSYTESSKVYRVVDSSYTIVYGISSDATYIALAKSQWTTTIVANAINYGVSDVASALISAGKIASGTYKLDKILNVWQQEDETVVDNYKAQVQIENSSGSFVFNSTIWVRYTPSTKANHVYAYTYSLPVSAPAASVKSAAVRGAAVNLAVSAAPAATVVGLDQVSASIP